MERTMTIQQEILDELQAAGFHVTVWPPGETDSPHPRSLLTDGDLAKVIAAAHAAGAAPWTTETAPEGEGASGDNWMLADFGLDDLPDGSGYQQVYLVTDQVRCSERAESNGALSEAQHAATSDPLTVLRMAGELQLLRRKMGAVGQERPRCNGKGKIITDTRRDYRITCPDCKGRGAIVYQSGKGYAVSPEDDVECPRCAGSGWVKLKDPHGTSPMVQCEACKGTGVAP